MTEEEFSGIIKKVEETLEALNNETGFSDHSYKIKKTSYSSEGGWIEIEITSLWEYGGESRIEIIEVFPDGSLWTQAFYKNIEEYLNTFFR